MHRTEGTNNSAGQFTDGPPGTTVESRWLNAVQEEILYVIEEAGLTPNTAAADSSDQLKRAIELMLVGTVPYTSATTNYTFSDTDGIELLLVDPSARAITVTLPTAADNAGRHILVKVTTAGGAVTVAGEGAELIDAANTFVMQSIYDFLDITCNGTKWFINGCYAKLDTGWINTADWTDRLLGNQQVTYNAGVGSYVVGEKITESTSGNTGIIMADTGSVLTLKNVTGTGTFTNARTITGTTSACARTVNGTTKNQDTDITHNFGQNMSQLNCKPMHSTDGTENNSYFAYVAFEDGNSEVGEIFDQVDTNSIRVQTGEFAGFMTYDTNGNFIAWDSEDYYYKMIVEYSK